VEANTRQFLGANMDNECKSGPLPSNGNLDKASFSHIVKNVSFSPCILVQNDPTITIPIVKYVAAQDAYQNINALMCYFNGHWPHLVFI
jgi:hypothetical protein